MRAHSPGERNRPRLRRLRAWTEGEALTERPALLYDGRAGKKAGSAVATTSLIVLFSIVGVVIAAYGAYGAWELWLRRSEEKPLTVEYAVMAGVMGLGLLLVGSAQILRLLLVINAKP
jgi:hypothetical protein